MGSGLFFSSGDRSPVRSPERKEEEVAGGRVGGAAIAGEQREKGLCPVSAKQEEKKKKNGKRKEKEKRKEKKRKEKKREEKKRK